MNWTEFRTSVHDLVQKRVVAFWRGQRDNAWKLQTTFHRKNPRNWTIEQYLGKVVSELEYHACAMNNEILNLGDPVKLAAFLGQLQHHGFPTPLLDWTLSPYIAAYFAFREIDDQEPQNDLVRIFAFDHITFATDWEQPTELLSTSPFISVIKPLPRHNSRILPQQGRFTVTNVIDMEAHLSQMEKRQEKTYLYRMDLPVSEKKLVMAELDTMGINEMTLFPDFDGLCRYMKEVFFSPEQIGLTPSTKQFLNDLASVPPNFPEPNAPSS